MNVFPKMSDYCFKKNKTKHGKHLSDAYAYIKIFVFFKWEIKKAYDNNKYGKSVSCDQTYLIS